jgi:hypothetical protein
MSSDAPSAKAPSNWPLQSDGRLAALPRASAAERLYRWTDMDAREALCHFLQGTIEPSRVDRFVGFASRPRSEAKCLDELHNYFRERVAPAALVTSLPDRVWNDPAYSFSLQRGFGVTETTMRTPHEGYDDGILVISQDGRFGYFRPESWADGEILVAARSK